MSERTPAAAPGHVDEVTTALDTGHDYDGIRELDNLLPRWWLLTLYGAMVFSVGYWAWYQTFHLGPSAQESYASDLAAVAAGQERALAGVVVVTEASLHALALDTAVVTRGAALYQQNCLACHGDHGQGLVGPNLTDEYWLHGGQATDVLRVVSDGVLDKGMPSWKPVLGPARTYDVVAFVISVLGTNAAGKAPQGVTATGGAPPPGGT